MNRGLIIMAVIGVLLIVGLSVGLAVVATSQGNSTEDAVCITSGCVETASRVLKDINSTVEPCDNFYEFACGGYLASTPIPDGEINVDPFGVLAKTIENQLKLLIEEPSSPAEARPFKLAKTLYRTCMNTSAIEKAGLEPLHKILRKFGKWPVIEGDNWNEADFNWVDSVHESQKLGYSSDNFIRFSMNPDWTNTTRYMLVLDQPAFGLPRDDLIEGIEYFVVRVYYDYMVDVAVLLGADRERAAQELAESLEFEIELAKITLPEEERRNYTLLDNHMTIAELNRRFPIVDWEQYINALLPPTVRVNADEVVTVREPNFVIELEKLLKNTTKRVQANYALWRVVADSAKYLTKSMREREAEFEAAKTNTVKTESVPRWKECLAIVSDTTLSLSTSALYVRKYSKEEAKQNVVEMVTDIKNELIKTIEKADWMDEITRSKAMEKAVSMTSLVAYPIELLDDNELEKFYANFTLRPDDFLGNILESNILGLKYFLGLLRKPVDKQNWVLHEYATKVNAFYDPAENSILIPASVLQGTFFSSDRPRYMNYGSTGYMLGHEMTHGFDNKGSQFDKSGILVNWWTPETAEKYTQKTLCMINQYNNYIVESVDLPVDGLSTLAENIADNGGIRKAYQAYKEYVKRNGPEARLPGLKYTPEQMFWISAASIWCTRYRPEQAQYELTTDIHSPDRFRVIGAFSNAPEFAADFNCPVGSYMNPMDKCSVF